jgi:hypothetical protein
LAFIGQVVAATACEQFASGVQHRHPASAVAVVDAGATGKPRSSTTKMAIGPSDRHPLFATTAGAQIFAGATNTSGAGLFENGASLDPEITITYTGLKIKGGSANDIIENDAKNGIVIEGNGRDDVFLGGAGAQATLGNGTGDFAFVGRSLMGTNEVAGGALGDSVTFGLAGTAELVVGTGAEAGSTAGTASIGKTRVLDAAAGMQIDFSQVIISNNIVDVTANVEHAANLTTAENAAVEALVRPGVAFFNFGGNEYFIATKHAETAVSSDDAIVKLVGVHDLAATNISGLVTLHA